MKTRAKRGTPSFGGAPIVRLWRRREHILERKGRRARACVRGSRLAFLELGGEHDSGGPSCKDDS
eukprot:9477763-Pyramimonas_sp.AAC.1